MTPTRRELLHSIARLIVVTQDLVRATEENIRVSRRLREDIARLGRRPRPRRLARVGRAGGPTAPAAVTAIRLRSPK